MAGNAVRQKWTHTGTGASTDVSVLGQDGGSPGRGYDIPDRHIHVTGVTAGSNTVKIQGSVDGSNWVDWIAAFTADGYYIINDGPMYIRTNCTVYGSGTVSVVVQKFLKD